MGHSSVGQGSSTHGTSSRCFVTRFVSSSPLMSSTSIRPGMSSKLDSKSESVSANIALKLIFSKSGTNDLGIMSLSGRRLTGGLMGRLAGGLSGRLVGGVAGARFRVEGM